MKDSYVYYAFELHGHKVLTSKWVLSPKLIKPGRELKGSWRMWVAGRDSYRIGWPFEIHLVAKLSQCGES